MSRKRAPHRPPDAGAGAVRDASGCPALGAGLCTPVCDRWPAGLWPGIPEPLWPVGQPARRRVQGPRPNSRWMPVPQVLYTQVGKSCRRRRIVGVTYQVVFGTMARVAQILAACGWKINTALGERLNLDMRQRVAAVGRRVRDRAGQKTRDAKDVITRWTFHAQWVESSVDHHRQTCLRGYGIVAVLGDEVALSS